MEINNDFLVGMLIGIIIIYLFLKWFTRAPYAMEEDFEELLKDENKEGRG